MREEVILVDASGSAIGTADKATVHTEDTPLHLAFSCWLFAPDGQLLVTRRALSKKTWPGVWTNSFCGHPGPGERYPAAIRRRAEQELGLDPALIDSLEEVLPDFSYRAVDSSGIVENEICPVYVARLSSNEAKEAFVPNPAEIDSWAWVEPSALLAAAQATPFAYSPWLVEELADPRLSQLLGGAEGGADPA